MSFAVRTVTPETERELFHEASRWRAAPVVGQIDPTMKYPWREDEQSSESMEPPITVEGEVMVSALMPALSGDGVIVRLFNPSPRSQAVKIASRLDGYRTLTPVLLDEAPVESGVVCTDEVSAQIPPFGLKSFLLSNAP
jgi:alpha-mannosidase